MNEMPVRIAPAAAIQFGPSIFIANFAAATIRVAMDFMSHFSGRCRLAFGRQHLTNWHDGPHTQRGSTIPAKCPIFIGLVIKSARERSSRFWY
jgi:hypothetical protein